MLTKKMKKEQSHGTPMRRKSGTNNSNNNKKETFWSLLILCWHPDIPYPLKFRTTVYVLLLGHCESV